MTSKSKNSRKMKISQLSEESGLSKSTIRHYLVSGLLHMPIKTGKTAALYDEDHLKILKKIRQLKDKKGLSISEIKKVLEKNGFTTKRKTEDYNKREQIIEKAISNFVKNGFTGTTIDDITKAVGLKQSTFYSYFKSKRDFFLICAQHMVESNLNKYPLDSINNVKDFEKSQRLRTLGYLNKHRKYGGILNYLKNILQSNDPKQAQLASDTLRAFIDPIILDNRLAISKGLMIEIDPVLLAYAIFGLLDGISHALNMNTNYSVEDGVNIINDILSTYASSKD